MEPTVEEIKSYCRIDRDEEIVSMMKVAAEEYLKGAGIPVKYDDYSYKLTILSIISYNYEERATGAPDSCTDAITQLQLKYREGDTTDESI